MKIKKKGDPIYLSKKTKEAVPYVSGMGNVLPEAEVIEYTGTERQQKRKKKWDEFLKKWEGFKTKRNNKRSK
tara:strand:- start:574 stop:789 length:216 start_codon:yes stop_codon:yes gene_type:complete